MVCVSMYGMMFSLYQPEMILKRKRGMITLALLKSIPQNVIKTLLEIALPILPCIIMYYYADFDWPVLFKILYKFTRETDVQSLQFKIINRYIPCKENLYLWGKESSDKCSLCNEIDTIEHFFAQCSYNRVFWQGVSTLVQRALDINIKLYDLDIIFGLPGEEDVFQIINFCILYGKKYIFDCRINDNIVSINRFESKLKDRLEVEIYIIDSCGIRFNTKKILLMELYNSLCS